MDRGVVSFGMTGICRSGWHMPLALFPDAVAQHLHSQTAVFCAMSEIDDNFNAERV